MTIADLKQYRSICAEIKDIESELDGSYAGDTVQSGSKFPYSKHTVRIEGYVPDGGTVSSLARLSELKRKKQEIEDFVEGIPLYMVRKAIKLYYITPIEEGEDKPTWETVADEIGQGVTSQSVKMAVRRYMKNL